MSRTHRSSQRDRNRCIQINKNFWLLLFVCFATLFEEAKSRHWDRSPRSPCTDTLSSDPCWGLGRSIFFLRRLDPSCFRHSTVFAWHNGVSAGIHLRFRSLRGKDLLKFGGFVDFTEVWTGGIGNQTCGEQSKSRFETHK